MTKKGIGRSDFQKLREAVDSDSFMFLRVVCGYDRLSFTFHAPLVYLMAGQQERLVPLLLNREFQRKSWTGRHIRKKLELHHGIDLTSYSDAKRLGNLLDNVNVRVYRGSGKSSIAHGIDAWEHARDPETTILICSAAEDRAISFSRQVKEHYQSQAFKVLYPDRVGEGLNHTLTDRRISLAGRSARSPQAGLEAWGYTASIVGAHFNKFSIDDLTIDTNLHDLDGVSRFLAGISGLYEPRRIRRVHCGTVWDERDDHFILSQIPNFFSIVVPVEDHLGVDIEDVMTPGIPTNPEWHDYNPKDDRVKDLQELKEEIVSNPDEGARSYRINYLLDPTMAGGRIFPVKLVQESKWVKIPAPKDRHNVGYLVAYPMRDPVTRQILTDEDGNERHFAVDPKNLEVVIGCDQAISDEGDEWGVVALGRDHRGMNIVLDAVRGHGYESMLYEVLTLSRKYNASKVGLETGGPQNATLYWIKQDRNFRELRSKIEGVPAGRMPKISRIVNMVAEPLKSRRLYLQPDNPDADEELIKYKPSDRAEDGLLDAMSIAAKLLNSPDKRPETRKKTKKQYAKYKRKISRSTGLYVK